VGVGRVKMDNAPRAPRCKAAGKEKHRMRGSKSVRKRPNRTNDFCSRLGGRIVTDALRRPSCQKCHLTGVLAWLINGTGKCDEGPASVSLHVRFRSTHVPAPVAQHPVWPGPLPLA
jgi:ribosomal protein S27AE